MTGAGSLSGSVRHHVDSQASAENFPVALRILPRAIRSDLAALYRYARFVDDVGDQGEGTVAQRLAVLDGVEREIRSLVASGQTGSIPLQPLAGLLGRHPLTLEPFVALIEANRQDQQVRRYATWDALQHYCDLSAAPIGHLVLGVFDAVTPERLADSGAVCTALQLLEHLQDLGEDLRDRDRIYLPATTMATHGVTESDLRAPVADGALRAAVAAECERARALLERGRPLVASLHGWARVAVAGYVAGGWATLAAIEAADHEVLSALRKAPKRAMLGTALRIWWRS